MTMDRSTITTAIADLDDELALLTRRRQLLEEVLATYGGTTGWVEAPREVVPAAEANAQFALVDAKPAPKTAHRKWNYAEVAKAVRNAPGDIPAARHLSRLFGIPEKTGYHLIKRCRELGYLDDPQVPFVPAAARPKTPVRDLPKAKPDSGMFDPQAVAEALGGAA